MKKLSSIYKTFDIIVVPFPFVDSFESKKRPAIILSSADTFNDKIEHSVVAMITSAANSTWPYDIRINNLESCGLIKPSIIRLKLFTLDHRLIVSKIGSLSSQDKRKLQENFSSVFDDLMNIQSNS
jgi:mRNA interferase MazF